MSNKQLAAIIGVLVCMVLLLSIPIIQFARHDPGKQWDYQVERFKPADDVQTELKKLGEDSWELVALSTNSKGEAEFYFKRAMR